MKNKDKFKEFMISICEMHEKKISVRIIDLYWKVLTIYPDNRCIQAFEYVIENCDFMPKPSHLSKYLKAICTDKDTREYYENMTKEELMEKFGWTEEKFEEVLKKVPQNEMYRHLKKFCSKCHKEEILWHMTNGRCYRCAPKPGDPDYNR